MNCKLFRRNLVEYVDGDLPDEMADLVEAHLENCEVCSLMLDQEKKLSNSMSGLLSSTTGGMALSPEVQKNIVGAMKETEVDESFFIDMPYKDMMVLFETLSFREKWTKVMAGLKQPQDTGEYKWAKLQVKRLWSPAAAVAVPILILCLLAVLAGLAPKQQRVVNVRILEPETVEELEEPEDIPEPEIEPPDPEDIVEPTDTFIPSTSKNEAGPDVDFSPQPAQFDAVAIIKSPVIMKGIYGNRSPGARGSALGRFGGGGHTEGAVLRALRWLKKHQSPDGSWANTAGGGTSSRGLNALQSYTGMALLAYLAHGETPASPEFGPTVEKAIQWLVSNQGADGRWSSKDGKGYAHAIAAYALAEAFGLTKHPSTREAAQKAIEVVITGQNPTGGYRYKLLPSDSASDTSVMGWCAQALKAAKMAGLTNPGLDKAIKGSIRGFKANSAPSPNGGFGYLGPGCSGLNGVGVLCMQLLGAGQEAEAQNGLQALADWTYQWKGGTFGRAKKTGRPIYYWYYVTQAKFHAGGETWRAWNKQFAPETVKNQVIQKGAGIDGKDIGYWDAWTAEEHEKHARVMNTALCTLMLEVYYRYLPTFQKPEDIIAEAQEGNAEPQGKVEAQDLDIDIQL